MTNKLDLVREGYNKIAAAYTGERAHASPDVALLDELIPLLPPHANILDAGCGGGIPIAQKLSAVGRVLGVDFSEAQIALARANVPNAEFLCRDLTTLALPAATFDAIVSYYAIIHIPRELHAELYRNFCRMLKPKGYALLCVGANDLDDDHADDYMGTPMYWSHFDAETNQRLLQEAGFEILSARVISDFSEPNAGHLFVLAQKPG